MAWNDDLQVNTPAHEIAASTHNRILVLAGPGTGKSFAMKRRVARILENERVTPKEILAVTFTRVAAEDLHRELLSLGVSNASLLKGKTIHSLAMSILMRSSVLVVLGRKPRPLNKFEIEPLLSDLSRIHGNKYARKRLILAYGAAWARLQEQIPGYTRSATEQAFADELVAWLIFHNAMLMDEIIPHLYQYLLANPGAPERAEYKHILVDEYQDLNKVEQEVLKILGEQGSMCVIGDDNQSIYSFRHAHPDGIRQWSLANAANEHSISECRRCPSTVVRMANALIGHNSGQITERQMSECVANGAGEVVIRQYGAISAEANAVIEKVSSLISNGVTPQEIIILTQRKVFAEPIFRQLKERGIPVKSYYSESELDTIEAQERFAILKLFLDHEDRVALRWLLGNDKKDWRTKSYKYLMQYIYTNGTTPWEALTSLSDGSIVIPYSEKLLERFLEIKRELESLQEAENIYKFIEVWLPENDKTALLLELVSKYKEEVTTPQELYKKLYEAITEPEIPLDVSEVRIMSLHKSKGLSSPFVFIVGCVEGLLPSRSNLNESPEEQIAKIEEDRRLFYVGITRVKARLPDRLGYLAITFSKTMTAADAHSNQIIPARSIGGVAYFNASRFIGEMAPYAPIAQFNTPL